MSYLNNSSVFEEEVYLSVEDLAELKLCGKPWTIKCDDVDFFSISQVIETIYNTTNLLKEITPSEAMGKVMLLKKMDGSFYKYVTPVIEIVLDDSWILHPSEVYYVSGE